MDIKTRSIPPTKAERAAVDSVLGPATSGWEGGERTPADGRVAYGGVRRRDVMRNQLLPTLHALQDGIGRITSPGLDYLCRRLSVPPAEAYGVATAYALFHVDGLGDHSISIETESAAATIHVCDDIGCRAAYGDDPCVAISGILGSEDARHAGIRWERSPCLGQCEHGSAALLLKPGIAPERRTIAPFRTEEAEHLIEALREPSVNRQDVVQAPNPLPVASQGSISAGTPRLLKPVEPTLDAYIQDGDGFATVQRVLERGGAWVIDELKASKLSGRGGAAFPTGSKWETVAQAADGPHFFVCNADESEPGTFKDRHLIELQPYALIEAIIIAGLTTGSVRGYIYIRGEYPEGEEGLRAAIDTCYDAGWLGANVGQSEIRFDLEVRRGAGAYIAGEETALFNSIEGKRPEPRNKPPYPAQRGLFGKPTGVNNVETLFNVLEVLRIGGRQFARSGTPGSTGSRLFCLSGAVQRPGLYEAAHGVTLRSLLEQAGGVTSGRQLRAILLGGAAGSFVGPEFLETPLSREGLSGSEASLGSGVVMVFDDQTDMAAVMRRIAQFFRDESCGQCVPCRVGTVRQEELLVRLGAGSDRRVEIALFDDLAGALRDTSICGLGQTAPNAIGSALRLGLI